MQTRTMKTATLGTDFGGRLVTRRVRVHVIEGEDRGAERFLGEGRLMVGSAPGADLVLQDRGVSRMHAELALLPRGIRLTDLGSRNGTWVGEVKIESIVLQPGATFVAGKTRIALEAADVPVEEPIAAGTRFGGLVGVSPAMRRAFGVLERVASTELPVWIEGEPGTGKTEAAQAVHGASARADGPLITVDAAGSLSRGEVAVFFADAAGGTIVIDNVEAAPSAIAAELIVALDRCERGEIDARPIATCALHAAPNPELESRLGVVRVVLPPLRERREDVGLILGELARRELGRELALEASELPELQAHALEGNVRDLRRIVDAAGRGAAAAAGAVASDSDALARLPYKEAKNQLVDAFERHYVRQLLDRHQGDLVSAAKEAGVVRHHLAALARKHGLID